MVNQVEFPEDIKKEYPFQSRYLELKEGGRIHYIDEGEGETLLFLHGNPSWSFYYRDLIKGLKAHYRCVAVDHMGMGLSDKPWSYPYTLSQHIENISILADHLQLKDVTLIVHDWGGPIGLGWALKDIKKIKRLVLFNTAAFLSSHIHLSIAICRWPIFGSLAIIGGNAFAKGALRRGIKNTERLSESIRRGYLFPYKKMQDRIANLRFVQDIPMNESVPSFKVMQEIENNLHKLQNIPKVIFWGMKDFCFTPHFLSRWEAFFPEAKVVEIKDAGHYVVEDAHELILPQLIEFLK